MKMAPISSEMARHLAKSMARVGRGIAVAHFAPLGKSRLRGHGWQMKSPSIAKFHRLAVSVSAES